MKRKVLGFLLAGLLGFGLSWGSGHWLRERTTLTRLAPDDTLRASLVERAGQTLGRNFQLRIEDLIQGRTVTIFQSPEEGMPSGTERLIWSRDGAWLLLVGRHFFVKEDLFLDNGDQLFLLHHRPSGRTWCNSDDSGLNLLTAAMIDGIDFTEPVTLKPR